MSEKLPYPVGEIDEDGLDEVEAIVADAAAVEGVGQVHEGGSYYAERIIRRAMQQGKLSLATRTPDLREVLERVRDFLEAAPFESGVCCCGSPVDGHSYGDGHSPVDELQYAVSKQIEAIDAALSQEEEGRS